MSLIRVTAALIEHDGKILIAQRGGEGNQALKWEFPGGKIDPGEAPEECLKRELKEELNLDVRVGELFDTITFDYPTWTIQLLVYQAEIIGGEMQLNVHQDVRWVDRSEIAAYDFCPADVELVNRLSSNPVEAAESSERLRSFHRYIAGSLILSTGLFFLFAVVAEALSKHGLYTFDQTITGLVRYNNSPAATKLMIGITTLGSSRTMIFLGLAAFILLAFGKKHFWDGTMVLIALSGSWIINGILKEAFHRTRPELGRLVTVSGFSFPSGHAMVSFSFYGMLAYLLWINVASKKLRIFFVFCFAVLIFAIGISRIYLGVHYPSDVLAGFTAGGVWLIGCILGLQSIRYYKAEH